MVSVPIITLIDSLRARVVLFLNTLTDKIAVKCNKTVFKQWLNSLVPKSIKMQSFVFKLFQLFGVFPFKIKIKKIRFSKVFYMWSILITSLFTLISIKRCSYYTNSINKYNYMFTMLVNYEPFLGLTEICLSTIPIYFSLKLLKKYIQSLVNLSSSNARNKKVMTVVVLIIFEWCVLVRLMQIVYYPTCETTVEKIDGILDAIQSIFRSAHLLHFYVALNGMVEHMKVVERDVENVKLDKVFDEASKVLEAYEKLGKAYQFFVRFVCLEVFYDTLTGVKKLEDFLIDHYGVIEDESQDFDAFIVFWWLFHVPLLMMVIHEGHLFHEKVKLCDKR